MATAPARSLLASPGDTLGDRLVEHRFKSIHRHVPALHVTAQLNLAICVFVMWRQGIDPLYYAWTPLLAAFSIWRIADWRRFRRTRGPLPVDTMRRSLRGTTAAALGAVTTCSVFSAVTFALSSFGQTLVLPVSLAFCAIAIAHCLASMRGAAIALIVMGVMPLGVVMLVSGNFEASILAVAMLSVALLNIALLRDYHRGLIARLELASEVERLADHDALTGLLNRRALFRNLEEAIERGDLFAVAVLDLDGFKLLNDTYGHLVGDGALQAVATRLSDAVGPHDCVARLGGDEFVVKVADTGEPTALERRFDDLLAALEQPTTIGAVTITTPGSFGYARFPDDGATGDELYAAADAALYAAKRAGKGGEVRSGGGLG